MELLGKTSCLANGANADLPVRCTRELLHPFFTDDSHQIAMNCSDPPALPELRLVLLGRKGAGKSACGDTILGETGAFESGKPTEQCEKRSSNVAERSVTVVDSPGWEWYYPHNGTPSWVKRETVRSVTLCPPGPHAVLLVIRSCASVTDAYISAIEEHLEPLGKEVWDHIMLLFTRGDELGLVSMEQRILTSGPALQKLLKRCSNRYHAFNNRSKDATQVAELMLKLEEMVEEKHGGHLEVLLSGLEEDGKRRARERRRKQRQMEVQMQRGTIKAALMSEGLLESELDAHNSFSKSPRRLPEVRLVLLGERETGKSTAGNYILGNMDFFKTGAVTEECVRKQAVVSSRQVTVVDTPGWECGVAGPTLERVKREIVSSVAFCPPGPHAFLLTLRVDTLVRAGHVREHLELLGEGVWRHTMLLFTHEDQLRKGVDVDQHIQDGGRDVKQLLEKCRGRYHIVSSSTDATCLLEKVEKMAVTNRCEAFSELVVEIQTLTCQKNERFNLRMKDVIEKMNRKEVELKRMREKEMKGILWFFDRRRKSKHSAKDRGKKEEDREEDGELRHERKNDLSDLEERIRWLTEDKEREILDLSIENERIRAALSQKTQAIDKAAHSLQLKDRQIEELTERIDEQQLRLHDLEKAGKRIQKAKDSIVEAEMLKEMHERENLKLRNQVSALKDEIAEVRRHLEDTLQSKANGNKSQMELKLLEKEKEKDEGVQKAVESLRLRHAEQLEEREREIRQMKQKHQTEMEQLEMERVQREKEVEELKQHCDTVEDVKRLHLNEINEMQQKHQKYVAAVRAERRSEEEAEVEKVKKILRDNQVSFTSYREEKEHEIAALKLQHQRDRAEMKSDLENLIQEVKKEAEEKGKIQQRHHEEEIQQLSKEFEGQQRESLQQSQSVVAELEQKYGAQTRVMQQQSEQEILKLKEVFSEERNRLLTQNGLEKEELEQKYSTIINEKEEERRKEIQELKEKNRQSEQRRREAEDQRYMLLEEQHKRMTQELEAKLEEDLQQGLLEWKDSEQEYMRKELAVQSLVVIYQKEIEELKGRLKESQDREISHFNDTEKMEQRLEEGNSEIRLMKLDIEQMKEKLQQREEEIVNNLTFKREMETKLKGREGEMETMEHKLEENIEITKRLQLHINDIDQILQLSEGVAPLEERTCESGQRDERSLVGDESCELRCRENKDAEVLLELTDRRTKEILRIKSALEERDTQIREARKTRTSLLEDISNLKESNKNLSSRVSEMHQSQEAQLQENGGKMKMLLQREEDHKKEIVQLRMTIELTKSELMELTTRMETEMTSMIQGYEEEIERIKRENERVIKEERNKIVLKQEECLKSVQELQEQNNKMRNEAEEVEAWRVRYEQMKRRGEAVEDLQLTLEEMKEREDGRLKVLQDKVTAREKEVEGLKVKLEKMKEKDKGWRAQIDKMVETLQRKENEIECLKVDMEKMKEREDEALKDQLEKIKIREEEVNGLKAKLERIEEREFEVEELKVKLEEMKAKDRDVEDLLETLGKMRKRVEELEGLKIQPSDKREVEDQFPVWKREEQNRGEIQEIEELQKHQKQYGELKIAKSVEHELGGLLRTLEVKQQELTNHGQDLQRKVKSIHHQGKELKDKERELLHWQAELQKQSVNVTGTTQQLGEMGRGLALIKEQLQTKEENLKKFFKKLLSWQQNLEGREALLHKTERHVRAQRQEDDLDMHEDVRGVAESVEWRENGQESDQVEGVTDEIVKALSAEECHKCHPEYLQELKQGIPRVGEEVKNLAWQNKSETFSQVGVWEIFNLEVLVLREHWSTRSPAGVTILGGEAPSHTGSGFRPWRGQIAGRHLTVVEPLGLKWRDGPDPQNTEQQKNILDSVSWCRTGPHVVLLFIPTFINCTKKYRRAVEQHLSLVGEMVWSRVIVVFTWGETLGESSEQHIQRNGELQGLLSRCGGRYHMMSSRKNNSAIEGLLKKMEDVTRANAESFR
ncbi:uncharacterized protein ACB058_001234 [Synchiropus picturatus]